MNSRVFVLEQLLSVATPAANRRCIIRSRGALDHICSLGEYSAAGRTLRHRTSQLFELLLEMV